MDESLEDIFLRQFPGKDKPDLFPISLSQSDFEKCIKMGEYVGKNTNIVIDTLKEGECEYYWTGTENGRAFQDVSFRYRLKSETV